MLRALLPATVAFAEVYRDLPGATAADIEELPAGTVPERRREYATTRWCARFALGQLGIGAVPIPVGRDRAPIWPAGTRGSLTHCPGYRAAAVAWGKDVVALGIDAEVNAPLPAEIVAMVVLPSEVAEVDAISADCCGDRLLFSAKEAAYKAWYPLSAQWLEFTDIALTFQPADDTGDPGGCFRVKSRIPMRESEQALIGTGLGQWTASDRHIFSSMVAAADVGSAAV